MVSGHHRMPWVISVVTRGRWTAQSGTFGAVILEARIGSPWEAAGRLEVVTVCLEVVTMCLAVRAAIRTSAGVLTGPTRPSNQRAYHPCYHQIAAGRDYASHDWW